MAAPSRPNLAEPFEERIALLFEELELAVQFDRPSILLAVYRSEFVREDAEALLTEQLRGIGQAVVEYRVANEESADIPLHLVQDYTEEERAHNVFFVSGLRHGGGRNEALAYYALNIRREYLVDYRIRAVFWLTEGEAQALPRLAPDFWAFRHRSIDLIDAPAPERIPKQARNLAWRDWKSRTLREDTDTKIQLREDLLAELPEGDSTRAARFDLLYTLGSLCSAKGDHEKAVAAYHQAIDLDPKLAPPHHGLGNAYRNLKRYDEAIAAYQQAIKVDPQYAYAYTSLGNAYRDLKRYDEAIAAYQQAITLDPNHAYRHNMLGLVYRLQARYDDAIEAYRQAIALDPSDGNAYVALASIYRHLGDSKRSAEYAAQAEARIPADDWYNLACLASVRGDTGQALDYLVRAAQSPDFDREWAQNDPDFEWIREDPRFAAIVGEGDAAE